MRMAAIILCIAASIQLNAQTSGTMTFTFTQTAASSQATKNVLAVWIEDANGNFVKTRMRFWGNSTNDHLPDWVSKSAKNTTDAITGATLKSTTSPTAFGVKTVSWDGTNISGAIVPDGTYKIFVESAWCNPEPANNTHKFISSFTFVKGPSASTVNPSDVNLSAITISWAPSTAGLEEFLLSNDLQIFPNPSTGIIVLNPSKSFEAKSVIISNSLGMQVMELNNQYIDANTKLDLSKLPNGIYLIDFILENGVKFTKSVVIKK